MQNAVSELAENGGNEAMAINPNKKPDRLTNHLDVGDVVAGRIYAAMQPVDQMAIVMEGRWGVGRLERIVSVDTASRFGAAREKLNQAIDANDADLVTAKASVMVRAWQALDKEATDAGHEHLKVEAWVAHDDEGQAFTVVKTLAEAHAVAKQEVAGRVYHLQEIARIIASFERRAPVVQVAKDTFKNATVSAINYKKVSRDEIPF